MWSVLCSVEKGVFLYFLYMYLHVLCPVWKTGTWVLCSSTHAQKRVTRISPMISRQIICSIVYIFNFKSPASVITVWGSVCLPGVFLFSLWLSWDPPVGFAGNSAASAHASGYEFLTSAIGCWTQVNSTPEVFWVNRQNEQIKLTNNPVLECWGPSAQFLFRTDAQHTRREVAFSGTNCWFVLKFQQLLQGRLMIHRHPEDNLMLLDSTCRDLWFL